MTPSLVVAAMAGVTASRTTKSDMRMSCSFRDYFKKAFDPLLTLPRRFRRTLHVAGGGRAPMIHDLFFVLAHLPLQLVHHQIDGGENILIALAGDKVVLVLRGHQELD